MIGRSLTTAQLLQSDVPRRPRRDENSRKKVRNVDRASWDDEPIRDVDAELIAVQSGLQRGSPNES
jgi:hypothetical protein